MSVAVRCGAGLSGVRAMPWRYDHNQEDRTVETIQRVKVLTGHTDADSAYVVEDYPYGRTLRCKIRYWIERAEKGSGKGAQRFARQTTNPKREGEVWNKPHYSTYSEVACLYLDPDTGYVEWWGAGFHVSPEQHARAELMEIPQQLPHREHKLYYALVKHARKYAEPWETFETVVGLIVEHMRENEGQAPELVNSTWQAPTRLYYLSQPDVYMAVARQRLESE